MLGRDVIINKIRAMGFRHKKQAKRVNIFVRGRDQIHVPRRKRIEENWVRETLRQHGLTPDEIEDFLKGVTKTPPTGKPSDRVREATP